MTRWTKQTIVLENPTDETLELIPTVSNTNNFSLERDNERPLVLRPRSAIEVPIHFMPSTLGQGDHLAKVIFNSEQVSTMVAVEILVAWDKLCSTVVPSIIVKLPVI